MMNLNKFAFTGAIALAGAMGFTACSSDDDITSGQNPTFDGETVKTQFAINIPHSAPGTRMTADNTQNNSNFLGMNDIRLVAFDGDPESTANFLSIISLENLTDEISSSNSSEVYENVNVPTTTDHFLFYGTAPKGSDAATKFSKGSLIATLDNVAAKVDIKFALETVKGTDENNEATSLVAVLNAVDDAFDGYTGSDADFEKLETDFRGMKAGSANNIKAMLENLYNTVDTWAVEAISPDSPEKTAAQAIRTAITNGGTFSVSGTSAPYTLATSLTYPQNINLPDGAVKLKYESGSFAYDEGQNLTGLSGFDASKLCYPASLYYFIATAIATNDNSYDSWPTTATDWESETWTGWGTEVTSETHAIALKENIQYAVASMKLGVKCTSGSLPDNGTEHEPNAYIPVPTDGFKVTGVLIGGQPSAVDWQFAPTASNGFDFTVYDKVSNVSAKYNADGGTNYTLVLPNTQTTAATVNFAIELENGTGVEFRGRDGVVPVGGKFYLVGQLDPDSKTVSGVTNPQVFMSDYETTVNATISTLENAYNTIPDLRATQLQLGLSVDLDWETGMSFDDVVIGGN